MNIPRCHMSLLTQFYLYPLELRLNLTGECANGVEG